MGDKVHHSHEMLYAGEFINCTHCGHGAVNADRARDVMSAHAQRVKGFKVISLDVKANGEDEVRAALVEDKTAGPAETAAARIDLAQWFWLLSRRKRRIARLLAAGETTKQTARQFGVSTARVSQLRQGLRRSWLAMQGEWTAA